MGSEAPSAAAFGSLLLEYSSHDGRSALGEVELHDFTLPPLWLHADAQLTLWRECGKRAESERERWKGRREGEGESERERERETEMKGERQEEAERDGDGDGEGRDERESDREQRVLFGLERSLASEVLRGLLVQNKYMREHAEMPVAHTFSRWPSRDRHQLWAFLWLAMRFVPEARYSAKDVRVVVHAHLEETAEEALVKAIIADLLRRGLLVNVRDGVESVAHVLSDDVEQDGSHDGGEGEQTYTGPCRYTLSSSRVKFVLDGDKLFATRAAVISRRPWWALPLAAQWVSAPRASFDCTEPRAYRRYRCVLLEPVKDRVEDWAYSRASVTFVPTTGADERHAVCHGTVQEDNFIFASLETHVDKPTVCCEVRCMLADRTIEHGTIHARLPPFRIDGWDEGHAPGAGRWSLLVCQPMPTAEEICNNGRDSVRCFLPHAVPTAQESEVIIAKKSVAGLIHVEGGIRVLSAWPRKAKQQALGALFLAHFLVPGRQYIEREIDWLIGTRFTRAKVPDCPTIRKELERCGLVERLPGGGGVQLREEALKLAVDRL